MATTPNVVKFKRSSVAGKIPQTTDLNLGELALNTYDGRIYLKKSVSGTESVVTIQSFPEGGTSGQILSLDPYGNLTWITSSVTSSGTVTAVSVVNANGFAGTVATASTTPAITIQTTVNGLLKGNGTSVSAATVGTDYLAPNSLSITTNSAGSESLTYSNGVFTFTPADLSSYVTSTSLSSTLGSYVTSTSLSSTLSDYVTSTSLSSTLGSYVTSSTLSGYNYISLTSLSMDTPGSASGSGSVTYSNTTGKFKYTPPDLSSYATQTYVTSQGYITNSVTALTGLTSIGSSGVDTTANGNLIVTGNLTVNGSTTTINSTTVNVEDKYIVLGNVATPTDATASGGGIELLGTTNKTFYWTTANSAWESSENIDLPTGKSYMINGVNILTGLIKLTNLSVGTPNAASGSGSISYSNTTGVFTYTPPDLSSYVTSTSLSSTLSNYVTSSTLSGYNYITLTSLSMDTPGSASGSGSVTYSNTTGKFKYTPPDLSSYITASVATLSSLTSIGSSGVDTTANGNLIVTGNLTVNGTVETINSTTVTVADKNIELGKVATPTDTTANGGGITLKGTTDKTLNWVSSTPAWTSSENFDLASGKTYKIGTTDVLSSTTLGANVVNSSLTSVGTLTNLTVTNTITGSISGNANTATSLQTPRKINGVSFDGSADITVTAAAGTLTGDTLNSSVTKSSLTQVGTLTNLTVTNTITGSVTGNAGTVTNGVYTTGSYANPSWITSLDYSKLTNVPTLSVTTNSPGTESLTYSSGVFTFTPYNLPTASTTVLGGVKVDGTTITISDGVISSAGGSSHAVSYDANQGLTSTQQANARANIGLDDATLYFYSYMFG